MKYFIKKVFIHSLKKYVIIFIVAVILVLIGLLINGFDWTINYVNSFFFSGFAMICIGGLSIINYYGGYDFMAYAFSKKHVNGKKIQYIDYIEKQNSKRESRQLPFGPYFVIGVLFLIISILIYAISF